MLCPPYVNKNNNEQTNFLFKALIYHILNCVHFIVLDIHVAVFIICQIYLRIYLGIHFLRQRFYRSWKLLFNHNEMIDANKNEVFVGLGVFRKSKIYHHTILVLECTYVYQSKCYHSSWRKKLNNNYCTWLQTSPIDYTHNYMSCIYLHDQNSNTSLFFISFIHLCELLTNSVIVKRT